MFKLLWLDPAGHKMPETFHYSGWSCGTVQVLVALTTLPAASVAVLVRVKARSRSSAQPVRRAAGLSWPAVRFR